MYEIFTYIWLFLMVKSGFHVGKYTMTMDSMGFGMAKTEKIK